MTPRAARRNNVYLANRHFRELLGGSWRRTELTGWRPALKEFALRSCRRIPGFAPSAPQGYKYPITFEVDLEAPRCVRPLDVAHRREPVLS
jgi:hypothetical protein